MLKTRTYKHFFVNLLAGFSLAAIVVCGNAKAVEADANEQSPQQSISAHDRDIQWLRDRIETSSSRQSSFDSSLTSSVKSPKDAAVPIASELVELGLGGRPAIRRVEESASNSWGGEFPKPQYKPNAVESVPNAAKPVNVQVKANVSYYDDLNDIEPVAGENAQSDGGAPGLISILSQTHKTSPVLKAQREQLRLSYEDVFEAQAGWLPSVTAAIGGTSLLSDSHPGGNSHNTAKKITLSVSQPVYRSGRTQHATTRERNLSLAAYEEYLASTQDIFLSAVDTYLEVVKAKAAVNLNEKNEARLRRAKNAVEDQYNVGQLTITDVSQAQARLAGAHSQVIKANGALKSRIASFRHITGVDLNEKDFTFPDDIFFELPATLNIAVSKGLKSHPDMKASEYKLKASNSDVYANYSELMPEIALNGALEQEYDPNPGLLDRSSSASLSLSATVQLFDSGLSRSRIRRAKISKYVERNNHESVRRDIRENVTNIWEEYQTAASVMISSNAQLGAARIARAGVYEEKELGARTVLDALDADQELLDAEVAVVDARKAHILARFSLAAAMGELLPENIGLERIISVKKNQENTKATYRNMFSTDVRSMDK